MSEHYRVDQAGPWRRLWHLRTFAPHGGAACLRRKWWWHGFVGWLLQGWYASPVSCGLRSWRGGSCYCPSGLTTNVCLIVNGVGFQLWLTRDRGPRPCLCELSAWLACPDLYAEELAEHGGPDRVEALARKRQEAL